MKNYLKYFLTIAMVGMLSVIAKAADDDNLISITLFDQFEDGYVILKSKARVSAKLNFDKIAEKILFLDGETMYELEANTVSIVVIKERFFVPVGDKYYYERIAVGEKEFFIRHRAKVVSKGKPAGYGTYSQSSAITGISSITSSGQLYALGTGEKFEGKDESSILLIKGKKYERIGSLKVLISHFKSHQSALEAYAKENKTNFAKMEDVKAIVEYAFSLFLKKRDF